MKIIKKVRMNENFITFVSILERIEVFISKIKINLIIQFWGHSIIYSIVWPQKKCKKT